MVLNEKAVKKRIAQLQAEDNDFSQELDAYYDAALSYISNHLSAFYERYADENGLTVTQAAQTIGKWDKAQWQMAIDELNSDGWLPESKKRAKFLGNYAGLNVGNMIAAIAGLGIVAWLDKAVKRSQKRAGNVAKGEKDFLSSYKLATGAYNTGSVSKVLSDSIWIDGDRLIDDVRAELFKCYQTGKPLDELRQKLIRQVKPTPGTNIADRMAQAESKVDRLIRSESAKMIDEIDTAAYKKAGVEYVNWVTEPGACARCTDLKESGPYPIDKAPALVIDSHPNCRCAKVPSEKSKTDIAAVGGIVGMVASHAIERQYKSTRTVLDSNFADGIWKDEVNPDKQKRHMSSNGKGTPQDGTSRTLFNPDVDIEKLYNEYKGTGKFEFDKQGKIRSERVNLPFVVGVDNKGRKLRGIKIHYSNTGAHLVPWKGDGNDEFK